jgi:flagellar biosynthesis/type III secretory pathway protein FliH
VTDEEVFDRMVIEIDTGNQVSAFDLFRAHLDKVRREATNEGYSDGYEDGNERGRDNR